MKAGGDFVVGLYRCVPILPPRDANRKELDGYVERGSEDCGTSISRISER
jgi:hypothetical protein